MRIVDLSAAFVCAGVLATEPGAPIAQTLRWEDLPAPIERRLVAAGLDARAFPAFLERQQRLMQARMRESDMDALIYYALQSVSFTDAPPIEPAASAKVFVDELDADLRERFLSDELAPIDRVPIPVRDRLAALIRALQDPSPGSRLGYFRELVPRGDAQAFLLQQYVRAARFLYEKEFVVPARQDSIEAIAALYRQRALSTDTSVEAGYLMHLGLAWLRALEAERRIRRVLIVGPGLELAPRTGLIEAGPPHSSQPYGILDSLVSLGLARLDEVSLLCADINPRVVEHLQAARRRDVTLTLITGIGDSATTTLDDEYRRYFDDLGRAIGRTTVAGAPPERYRGHLHKSLLMQAGLSRTIAATELDITSQRLSGEPFDLAIATNVFLYMDDVPLTLALAGIESMLAPGGVLIHNEPRALAGAVLAEMQMPVAHARTAQIASVRGATAPLYDNVFVHAKPTPR